MLKKKKGFPLSSAGKESASNAGDPGSIPGLGRSSEEGGSTPVFLPENPMDRGACQTTVHIYTKIWTLMIY